MITLENGKTLKQMRGEKGLTVRDMATLMNIDKSRISRIENSDGVTYNTVMRYLKALKEADNIANLERLMTEDFMGGTNE